MDMNPCFISYRHPGNPDADKYVQNFVRQLNKHLARRLSNKEAFFDQERLGAGDFFKPELASQLCNSAAMVICFSTCHFDITHPYCSLEYQAMLSLEKTRLPHLHNMGNGGLIFTVVFTGSNYLPSEIKDNRHCINFENDVICAKDFEKPACQKKIADLAERIEKRYIESLRAPELQQRNCGQFAFPDTATVMPWIKTVAPIPELPGR